MIALSERMQAVPASPIRKLAPLARAAARRGVHVLHLNIGQPDIKTPTQALAAIHRMEQPVLSYSPSEGNLSLRGKLSSYYAGFGISLSPEEIIVTTGGSEAIQFAFMACLDPGDEVIVTDPCYANYKAYAAICGATVRSVPTRIEDGFRLPPIDAFEAEITPRTRAILICNPNNPTGYLYSRREMLRLREIVLRHNLFLISDEVYREFVYGGGRPYISALQLEGLEENAVLVDSVSKRYSECGIRIGAMVTRNAAFRAAVLKLCQARLSPPLLGQLVAEASIDVPKSYLAEVNAEYRRRRDCLVGGLNRIPGVFAPMPEGAFYVMVRLPVEDAEDFCAWCLTDFEYEGETVMMAPGAGFYVSPGAGKDEVRMAYVIETEELERALVVLEKALAAYNSR